MSIDMKLAKKGRAQPRLGLIKQGRASVKVARQFRDELLAIGWTPSMTDELEREVDELDTEHAELLDKRGEVKALTRHEQAVIDRAKSFKRKVVVAFDDMYDDGRVPFNDYEIVKKSGRLERSSARISAYLGDIRKQLVDYGPILREYGFRDAVAELDRIKAELDGTSAEQDASLDKLPLETLKYYERKGRVLVLIQKLNRRARIAFDGRAEILALFNKDHLLAARRSRSVSAVEPVGETEPGGEQATG